MKLDTLKKIEGHDIDGDDGLKAFFMSNASDFAGAIKFMSQGDRKHFEGFLENGALITNAVHIGYGVITAYTDGGDIDGPKKYKGFLRTQKIDEPFIDPIIERSPFTPPYKICRVELSSATAVLIYTWKIPFNDIFNRLTIDTLLKD